MKNLIEWKRAIFQSKMKVAVPIMTHPGVDSCGYSVKKVVTDGAAHAEAICAMSRMFPSAACTVIMDLSVEAEAFGAEVVFAERELPNIVGRLVSDYDSVLNLSIPSLEAGRIPEYIKANRLAAASIKDRPVFAGCIGPFSLAGRLFDLSELMMAVYTEPATVHLLLEKCTEFIRRYVMALKAAGTDGVIIAEPAAGLISNDDCLEYSSQYISRIVREVQDEHFIVILHNCGNRGQCTQAMIASKADGLHFGNAVDMEQVLAECPDELLVMGNVDPVNIMKYGTPERVEYNVMELLSKLSPYSNFILSTGCDTPPGVPVENIRAFYDAIQKYNEIR